MKLVWAALVAVAVTGAPVAGQDSTATHEHSAPSRTPAWSLGASAALIGTVAKPGIANRTLIEGYVTQPMAMASLVAIPERLIVSGTVNLEGLTLERGELNAGVYGEGYVDRRHPHTWLHELVATGFTRVASARLSVTAGKGFIPFGTDDPMSRHFVKYPVNHHLAQLLERAGVIGALSFGALVVEGAAFNGDEPESPSDMPDWSRVGDSWALRFTVRPGRSVEMQASTASVESPEISRGGGLDHRKWSTSARFENATRYALIEWARTSESDLGQHAFSFSSMLGEASMQQGTVSLSVRVERTVRPEEERLENAFRTPRPHSDLSIAGRTRWDVLSGRMAVSLGRSPTIAPFVEMSTQHATALERPTLFEPRDFYGSSRMWSFTCGVRLGVGSIHSRMGRYGVAAGGSHH